MKQLAFRLETELTKISTNIDVADKLLHQESITHAEHRQTPHSITVDKEYLNKIQSEIHSYHFKLDSLSKEAANSQEAVDVQHILRKATSHIKRIEHMFFSLNSGYIKKQIPNSKQLLDDYERRTNGKYTRTNYPGQVQPYQSQISTTSKYGKVLKDGYLMKKGNVRKNWKKRLFILTADGFLRYYDSKQRLLNEIDLSTAKFLSVETEHSHFKKPNVLSYWI